MNEPGCYEPRETCDPDDAYERMMQERLDNRGEWRARIIATHVFPPVPSRAFDWCAYLGGEENGPHEYGPTREAAIAALLEALEDAQ